MQLYEFPSGRLFQVHEPVPLKFGLWVFLILSVVLLIWRCRQKPSSWDFPGWTTLLIAEWMLARQIGRSVQMSDLTFVSFLLMFLVCVAAIGITAWRRIQDTFVRNCVVALLGGGVVVFFTLPAIQQSSEAARRTQCKNNLKQIGLAIYNYADTYQQIPFAGAEIPQEGTVCSWRVAILPFLDASPWYMYYHFDEPWDSPFNKTAQERCPPTYHCPTHKSQQRLTDYMMIRGPETAGGNGFDVVTIKDLIVGKSNTIPIVEAAGTEIIWTEPKDVLATDESVGINLPSHVQGRSDGIISSYHTGGAHVLMGDGSVRFLSVKTDKSVLKQQLTIRGGEPTN